MSTYAVIVGLACIRHTYIIQARDISDAAMMTQIWDVVRIVRLGKPV